MAASGVRVTDRMGPALRAIAQLAKREVLIGIPSSNATRDEGSLDPINNAQIGYIMEFGSPAANIPARPHLAPGVRNAEPALLPHLEAAAKAATRGNMAIVDARLNAAGMVAVSAVRALITAGIAPALADSTVQARARRSRKGAQAEMVNRISGLPPSTDLAKPLIDTGEYRNKITYVVRAK